MIMNYEGILEFKGTWRRYQARVLEHADRYMADGKIHIVAAPGSGKTTLGIELIRRMNGKALILAPSITIREQWIARIEEAFLCEGIQGEDYLSQNLKQPKATIRNTMWNYVGISRTASRLHRAFDDLRALSRHLHDFYKNTAISKPIVDLFHGCQAAYSITQSALRNPRSLGCHHRIN